MAVTRVVVVDYGVCNLDSVRRALEECGAAVEVSGDPAALGRADRILLPGVGAFPVAMRHLTDRGLDEALVSEVRAGAPLLGICLGMQLLATKGTEAGGADGLGLIPATVERLEPTATEQRIPHVGWNEVTPAVDHPLFTGIEPTSDFYFVHSFHVCCDDPDDVVATTPYVGGFASAVSRGTVHGVQFHPEKSQQAGFALLRNFLLL
jgi:glutamine amidotransferase